MSSAIDHLTQHELDRLIEIEQALKALRAERAKINNRARQRRELAALYARREAAEARG